MPTVASSSPKAAVALRALWRPGVGMTLWRSEPADRTPQPLTADEVPAPLTEFLVDRAFRRTVAVVDADGERHLQPCVVLGATTTLAMLSALGEDDRDSDAPGDHLEIGAELRFYRALLRGVGAAVSAGAIVPAVIAVDGEYYLRWELVATRGWRSWFATMTDRAPASLARNDMHGSAIADFVDHLTDALCRSRLHPALAATAGTSALRDLVDVPRPLPPDRGPTASTAWAQWSSSAAADEPRVLFRLHLPEDPDTESAMTSPPPIWRLEVCRRDPTGSIAAIEPHRLASAELDDVTSSLATAIDLCPPLRTADADPQSLDFLLATSEAEEFLTAGAATLREGGFTVMLPRSIATVRPALHAHALPVAVSTGRAAIVGLDDLAEFEWRLALGDSPDATELSQSDLDALARQQGDLVRVRGQWVLAENAALTRAARFIADQRTAAPTDPATAARELLAVITGVSDVEAPVPVLAAPGLGWLDDMAAGRGLRPPPLAPPQTLAATLRPYQQRGLDWLAHLSAQRIGGVLADDMGLGKTVQVIALLCHERVAKQPNPTLVVCPMSLVGNWARELARFAPHLRVVIHHGPNRLADQDFHQLVTNSDVVLTTFSIVTRDRDLLASVRVNDQPWGRIVVDEAQHVKNVSTAAARALRSLDTDHRLALTGTPVENRLEDLRAVIDLVNPGLLGSASKFKARFAEPIERDRDAATAKRLRALTRPFILRRAKTDPDIVDGLPTKTELIVRANLTVEQAALYRAIVDELMAALADRVQRTLRRRTVLAALTRLSKSATIRRTIWPTVHR